MSDSESSRFVSRYVPSDELLPTIIEEANLDDDGIHEIERLLLTEPSLEPEVISSLCLVLGRCGWNRSQGTLRQIENKCKKMGRTVDAHVVRLAMALLSDSPETGFVERADEGYRYSEPGLPALFVSDPIAAHWHRQGRWGPAIRPRFDLPTIPAARDLGVSKLAEFVLDGRIVKIARGDEVCTMTRAWIHLSGETLAPIRWNRVRSLGRISSVGAREGKLALEVEGCPVMQVPVLHEDFGFIEELLKSVLSRIKNHAIYG